MAGMISLSSSWRISPTSETKLTPEMSTQMISPILPAS
jgi:hypothetical protein